MDSVVVYLSSVDLCARRGPRDELAVTLQVTAVNFCRGQGASGSGAGEAGGVGAAREDAVGEVGPAAAEGGPAAAPEASASKWLATRPLKGREGISLSSTRRPPPGPKDREGLRRRQSSPRSSPTDRPAPRTDSVPWHDYHRLRFDLKKEGAADSASSTPRVHSEHPPAVRVAVTLTANRSTIASGVVDLVCLDAASAEPALEKVTLFTGKTKNRKAVAVAHLRLVAEPLSPVEKHVFFVRHAESEYNRMHNDGNVRGMISDIDHGITDLGQRQCIWLAKRVADWVEEYSSESEAVGAQSDPAVLYKKRFITADAQVLCSPMKRAVQTAMLAFSKLPSCAASGLTVIEPLREIKSRGGFDCVASECGSGIATGAIQDLGPDPSSTTAKDARNAQGDVLWPPVDCSAVATPWWTEVHRKDGAGEIAARLRRLSAAIQHCRSETVILVGHSNLLREYFKATLNAMSARRNNPIASAIVTAKLPNAACLGTRMLFDRTGEPIMVDVELISGSMRSNRVTSPEWARGPSAPGLTRRLSFSESLTTTPKPPTRSYSCTVL